MSDAPITAIPAATLVLFRDRAGATDLLFVERAKAMAFAGGALVFPGGRIDPGDHALALTVAGTSPDQAEDMAARIAAIRETIEEAGMPIGLSPSPDEAMLAAIRAALHDGLSLGEALHETGVALDPEALIPFARWRPAHAHARIFDTRFYLARLPEDAPDPVVDETENVRVFWATAQSVLDDADAGRVRIIFPTRRNLERLAQFASFEEARSHAAQYPIRTVSPWTEERDGETHLCIPNDLGYPVTSQLFTSVVRG